MSFNLIKYLQIPISVLEKSIIKTQKEYEETADEARKLKLEGYIFALNQLLQKYGQESKKFDDNLDTPTIFRKIYSEKP